MRHARQITPFLDIVRLDMTGLIFKYAMLDSSDLGFRHSYHKKLSEYITLQTVWTKIRFALRGPEFAVVYKQDSRIVQF